MAKYAHLIPQNIADSSVKKIAVFSPSGKQVGIIPLGRLTLRSTGEKLYSFGALSDVHITKDTATEDFQKALTYLNEDADVAFACICGDLTENGSVEQLAQYKAIVDANSADTPVYAISGNHESFVDVVTDERLLPYTGRPLYYSFTQGNDVFIMCGYYQLGNETMFADGELQWIYETLEANRDKRCFVFFHVFPWGDCGNPGELYWEDMFVGTQGSVFQSLLKHYKNTLFFHGHSHTKFELQKIDPKANYSEALGYRSIHIPSLSVPRDIVGGSLNYIYADSEGYVVDVYENGVHLRGRDFIKGEFLPIASYWLDTTLQNVPAGTYKDETGTIITYTQIEYIQTSGTQYIDTGVVPSPNSRVICDFQATDKDSENHIFGSRSSSTSRCFAFSIRGTGTWRFGYGSGYTGSTVADTNRHIVDVNKNVCSLDGSVLYTREYEEFTGAYTIYVGAVKASSIYEGRAKIYSCQIYDNDTLVRDYVPCINADGEIGMWDKVNNVFYGNAGTGEFIIPA